METRPGETEKPYFSYTYFNVFNELPVLLITRSAVRARPEEPIYTSPSLDKSLMSTNCRQMYTYCVQSERDQDIQA